MNTGIAHAPAEDPAAARPARDRQLVCWEPAGGMTDHGVFGGRGMVGWASLPSEARPERNQDAFFAIPDRGFFGVFDGMGGHAAADVAARLAAGEVQDVLAPLASDVPPEVVADVLRDALFSADAVIRTEAVAREDPRGMGTTAAVAVVRRLREAPARAIVAWVGDSRAHVLSAGGRHLRCLTLDDGVVRQRTRSLAAARKLQAVLGAVTHTRHLTFRERDTFLERSVLTQAVGSSLLHVHMVEHALLPGEHLLLSTDGVHDNLTDRELAILVWRAASARDAAARLVRAARQRSRDATHVRAKPDDMTAIVIRCGE